MTLKTGFECSSDSDSEDEPLGFKLGKEDVHYEGTAQYIEYTDKINNAPGSTRVEEEELKCPKLSTGEVCWAHRSEEDMQFVLYMCPLIQLQIIVSIWNILDWTTKEKMTAKW